MDDDLHDFMFPEVRSFLNLEKWLFLDQKPGFVQAFDRKCVTYICEGIRYQSIIHLDSVPWISIDLDPVTSISFKGIEQVFGDDDPFPSLFLHSKIGEFSYGVLSNHLDHGQNASPSIRCHYHRLSCSSFRDIVHFLQFLQCVWNYLPYNLFYYHHYYHDLPQFLHSTNLPTSIGSKMSAIRDAFWVGDLWGF